MKKGTVALLLLLHCLAQGQNDPAAKNAFINQELQEAFDYWNVAHPTTSFHSSFKPYLSGTFSETPDSLVPFKFYGFNNNTLSHTFSGKAKSNNHYNLQVLPIADLEAGYDGLLKQAIPSAIGGAHIKFNINNNFTFAASIYGGQSAFPFFLDTTIARQKIIPAYGQAYGNSGSGYSFLDYTGYISYSPGKNKIFNFQAGRDKHFIGDGYRSLLLSDFGPANPYVGINTNIWRFQYNVWYTMMNDVTDANGIRSNYAHKFATFHYLSYNVVKEFNIGLFENIVWAGTDSIQHRSFDINYINPIVFLRPQEYAAGSHDNSFIGLNMSGIIFKRIKLYGQLAIDEFDLQYIRARTGWWANKQGWQLGAKYMNAFGIRGLRLQAEYNEVRPYTYSHGDVQQNYSAYGEPLAHPLGANFRELLGFINYRRSNWELGYQGMFALIGKDSLSTTSNVGQNIFLSYDTHTKDFGNYTTQGIKTTLIQNQLKLTYFIVPKLNMRVELTYIQRSEKNTQGYLLQNPYVSVAFKTSFWNSYRDF